MFDVKENNNKYYLAVIFKVKLLQSEIYLRKRFFLRNKLQKVSVIQNMEEDIQNYSPTVMFRGTPWLYNLKPKSKTLVQPL